VGGGACNALFEVVSMESDAAAAAVAVPAAKAGSDANNITCIIMRPLGLPGLATQHTTSFSYRQCRQRD